MRVPSWIQSDEQIRRDLQEALDAAWESSDPAALQLQGELFPAGKPTLEQFIEVLAHYAASTR